MGDRVEVFLLLIAATSILIYEMDVKIATSNTERAHTMCCFPLLTRLILKTVP